ncbi:L,D-transpeptidase family protein [Actinocorallia longicatena]|uniref:L,D-TPase catalytic domain-containing protein n=1 Tax=Actinocorallia longicatena TaxID=111803 RepID=A0ABP6QKV4_9ACTN
MKKVVLGAALVALVSVPLGEQAVVAAPSAAPAVAPAVAGAQAAGDPSVRLGSKGAAVMKLQKKLKSLHYEPGRSDGRFGGQTRAAVWAFQKINGLPRTANGTVGAKTWKALEKPKVWKSITPKKRREANRVEISIKRQLIVVYKKNKIALITHTSTGSGRYEDGAVSTTPRGYFRTYRKIRGLRVAKLGTLYNPIYFYRGYAMHGSPNVPLYPDSHGCARLPFGTDMVMFRLVPIGWQVYVK